MNKPSEKKPILRFANFNDAWEQRKLGDMVSFSKGSGYSKGDLKEDGTPIILYGRLYTKYETVISEVDTFVDEKKGSVFSKGGEVIVPASGETAEDISIASVVEKTGVLLGGDLNIITPPDDIDSAFLAISISNGKPHNDMAKMAQGKSVVHLHNSDLEKIDLPYPSYDEQRRISGFFSDLDNLITLHQRKLEQQKAVKKSMLQKLFPSENMLTPQFRFSGFSDDWKQYKLKDLLTFQNGFNGSQELFGEGVALISVMDILNNPFITYDVIRSKASVSAAELERYAVRYGDVLFQRSSENVEDAGSTNVYIDADKTAVFGGFVIRGKQKYPYSPKFMKYLLDTKAVRNQITRCAQGAQHINVSQETLQDITVTLPTQTEQRKIESFLFDIDELIISRQRWLDLLLKMKKALLQKMFV